MPTSRAAALIVLILAALVLGFAPILVRLTDAGPAASGFWRFAFALPWLLLMTARSGGEGIGRPSNWMVLAGGMLVLDLSFWHYSIALTSVANATTLTNLTPVVVTLVGWWLFRERPRALFLVALPPVKAVAQVPVRGVDQAHCSLRGGLIRANLGVHCEDFALNRLDQSLTGNHC